VERHACHVNRIADGVIDAVHGEFPAGHERHVLKLLCDHRGLGFGFGLQAIKINNLSGY
jgi:hypothetical protein